MPDTSQLNSVGNITKALLNALDQIEQYVSASQVGPDGKPSGTAIYMHMPTGYPIDPKMFANAWTPGGGSSSSSFTNDGTFAKPASQTAAATSSQYPPAPGPDQQLQSAIQNAWYTSMLVDQMLEVTDKGVATAWPDRNVSIEYYTLLKGIQPIQQSAPAQDVVDRVNAAQNLLYLKDDKGNLIGYTPLYQNYQNNRTKWMAAISAQAGAYSQAMSNSIAGQSWPVQAQTYANAVTLALDNLNSMGRQKVEDALDTIATQGENAVTALAALAKQMYDSYSLQLGGSISVNTPWSYISPTSWWDYSDESFGVQKITATSSAHSGQKGTGTGSFSDKWTQQQSNSNSGSAGFNIGYASASASASHDAASNAFADHANQYTWNSHADKSSSATVTLEFFIATIMRPWMLGDLFNMNGWYLVGQRKNSISDGTIANQIGEKASALLPMIPKAFLIIRNVTITCDDWGDAGREFTAAAQSDQGSGQSSSTAVAVHASYLFASASGAHNDQQSSGAFGSANTTSGVSFTSDHKSGGTLSLMGSQISGWIGQIQVAAPQLDDPTLPPLKKPSQAEAMAAGGSPASDKSPAMSGS